MGLYGDLIVITMGFYGDNFGFWPSELLESNRYAIFNGKTHHYEWEKNVFNLWEKNTMLHGKNSQFLIGKTMGRTNHL